MKYILIHRNIFELKSFDNSWHRGGLEYDSKYWLVFVEWQWRWAMKAVSPAAKLANTIVFFLARLITDWGRELFCGISPLTKHWVLYIWGHLNSLLLLCSLGYT
jgi:hypothetical protein